MTTARELLPCPFCGEDKVHICETQFAPENRAAYAVSCRTRGCAGVIFTLGFGLFESVEKAMAAWNHRAHLDAPLPDYRVSLAVSLTKERINAIKNGTGSMCADMWPAELRILCDMALVALSRSHEPELPPYPETIIPSELVGDEIDNRNGEYVSKWDYDALRQYAISRSQGDAVAEAIIRRFYKLPHDARMSLPPTDEAYNEALDDACKAMRSCAQGLSEERIDDLVQCGRTLEHYEHPSLRPLCEADFRTYDAARRRIAAIRQALSESGRDGWRDIESAPKDGRTIVDLWCVTDDPTTAHFYFGNTCSGVKDKTLWQGRVVECCWKNEAWRPGSGLAQRHRIEGTPTHWRELPPHPQRKDSAHD